MKKVGVTGASGTIGSLIFKYLSSEYDLISIKRPDVDARDYQSLLAAIRGCDAVIHLAWDTKTENFNTGRSNPDNILMAENAYRAALEARVKRVIMASSVHAGEDSPYGASKLRIEEMGRECARRGLEVICVRFGGVTERDYPDPTDSYDRSVYLSQKDFVNLIRACIEVERVENNFSLFYGVSNNKNKIHDNTNNIGWETGE